MQDGNLKKESDTTHLSHRNPCDRDALKQSYEVLVLLFCSWRSRFWLNAMHSGKILFREVIKTIIHARDPL